MHPMKEKDIRGKYGKRRWAAQPSSWLPMPAGYLETVLRNEKKPEYVREVFEEAIYEGNVPLVERMVTRETFFSKYASLRGSYSFDMGSKL